MQNYYQNRFLELSKTFDNSQTLEEIVKVLLFQNNKPKLLECSNKFAEFWNADFIKTITKSNVNSENYQIALSQYIRYGIDNPDLCKYLMQLDIDVFIIAIRFSGIVIEKEHISWNFIRELIKQTNSPKFNDFLSVIDKLQLEYQNLLDEHKKLKQELKIGQITAMIFSSLYAFEYLIPLQDKYGLLPYQKDINLRYTSQDLWNVFDQIIKKSKRNTKKLTIDSLGLALKNKLSPFLFSDGINDKLIMQYEGFKNLVAYSLEINSYQEDVFHSYSYSLETKYYLLDGELKLEVKDTKKDLWYEKFGVINNYWFWRGGQELMDSEYQLRIGQGKNVNGNTVAFVKTLGIIQQLRETLGIENARFNDIEYDLFELIITMALSQEFYKQDFIQEFELLSHRLPSFQALAMLMMNGLLDGMQNRMPFVFTTQKEKARSMSCWIHSEESNNKKTKTMSEIIDFWSLDLYKDNVATYSEKLFYKIDDFIFQMPWRIAFQSLNTSVINYFRKLYKNRDGLKSETDSMEESVANLFKQVGFDVYPQYIPEDIRVGEIDLIAIKDNIVIVLELKSSYIRNNKKEIFEYKNFVLKKAAYQLDKKTKFVREVFLNNVNSKIYSWIVDTSLEFDHEYIDGYLKLSVDELVILLKGHDNFMNGFFMMVEGKMDEEISSNQTICDVNDFVLKIENNRFWSSVLNQSSNLKNLYSRN